MNPRVVHARALWLGAFALALLTMLAVLIAAETGRQIADYALFTGQRGMRATPPLMGPIMALTALFLFFTAAGMGLAMAYSRSAFGTKAKERGGYDPDTLAALDHLVAAVRQRTDLTPEDIVRFESAARGLFDLSPRAADRLAERVALGDTLAAANDLADRWRLEYAARLDQAANLIQPFSPERAKALRTERDDFLRIKTLLKAEEDAKAEQKKRDEEARKAAEDAKKAEEERERLEAQCKAERERLKAVLDSMRDFCRCEQHSQKPCSCSDHSCTVCRCPKCRDGFDRAAGRHKLDIEFFM